MGLDETPGVPGLILFAYPHQQYFKYRESIFDVASRSDRASKERK